MSDAQPLAHGATADDDAALPAPDAATLIPARTTRRIGMIWAQSLDGHIGQDGGIPWHLPEDLKFFKAATLGHPVIMGRRTWESIPERFRPFPGRTNIVLTHRADVAGPAAAAGAVVVADVAAALDAAYAAPGSERVWIVGGGAVYRALEPLADLAVVTTVDVRTPDADTPAPSLGVAWRRTGGSPAATDAWRVPERGPRYRVDIHERPR